MRGVAAGSDWESVLLWKSWLFQHKTTDMGLDNVGDTKETLGMQAQGGKESGTG